MTKTELRKRFLVRRRALSAEDVTKRSEQIANGFFDYFFNSGRVDQYVGLALANATNCVYLHTFLPIQRQNEVNTWLIVHRAWQAFPQVRVVASVTDITTNRLTHCLLTPQTELRENRWGIPEPISVGQPINPENLDMVLVPLLAFDQGGHRVGYGKGYYDRFLSECRPACLKIGLSLFEPVKLISDTEPSDVALNFCIDPEQVHTF